jgi:hypothetical protein
MADPTLGLPSYNPQVANPNMRMMLGNMAMAPVVAPAAFGGVGGIPPVAPVQPNPWLPGSSMTPADSAYYRAAAQPLAIPPTPPAGPGAMAAARGLSASGFPVNQPGQGGTVAGLWSQALDSNGAQAGTAQPQPVGARMMGTADPTAGWPGFTNGAGGPSGFGGTNAAQPVSAQPLNTAALNTATGPAFAPSAARLARAGAGADGGSAPNELVGGSGVSPTPGAGSTMGLPAYSAVAAGQAQYDAAQPAASGRAGVGGGGLVNPSGAIATGYDQQTAYRRSGLADIMTAASQGNPNNYSLRLGHLVGALGNNNFAQVQGQGADSMNQAEAAEFDAGTMAGAQVYGHQMGYQSELARAASAERINEATPREIGSQIAYGPGGIPIGQTTAFGTSGKGFAQLPTNTNNVIPSYDEFQRSFRGVNPGMVPESDVLAAYKQKFGGR